MPTCCGASGWGASTRTKPGLKRSMTSAFPASPRTTRGDRGREGDAGTFNLAARRPAQIRGGGAQANTLDQSVARARLFAPFPSNTSPVHRDRLTVCKRYRALMR